MKYGFLSNTKYITIKEIFTEQDKIEIGTLLDIERVSFDFDKFEIKGKCKDRNVMVLLIKLDTYEQFAQMM